MKVYCEKCKQSYSVKDFYGYCKKCGADGNFVYMYKDYMLMKKILLMEDRMMRVAGSEEFQLSEYKSKITSIVTKVDTCIMYP